MATCQSCAADVPAGQEVLVAGKSKRDPHTVLCPNCASTIEQALQAETQDPNLILAILLGLVAAVAGSLIWYGVVAITNYQLGIVAVGIGLLVGLGVFFGSGRKRGPALQAISVVITLIAMVIAEYFVVRHFAVKELAEEGYTDIPWLLPVKTMVEIVIEGIKADLLTLLFWAIALWTAFAVPARRRLRRAKV